MSMHITVDTTVWLPAVCWAATIKYPRPDELCRWNGSLN